MTSFTFENNFYMSIQKIRITFSDETIIIVEQVWYLKWKILLNLVSAIMMNQKL